MVPPAAGSSSDGRHGAIAGLRVHWPRSGRGWCARGPGPRRFPVEAGSGSRSGRWPSGRRAPTVAPGVRPATSRPRMGGASLPVCPTESLGSLAPGLPRITSRRPEHSRDVRLFAVRRLPRLGTWPSRTSNRSALGWDVTVSAAVRSIAEREQGDQSGTRAAHLRAGSGPYRLPLETRSLDLAWLRPVSYRHAWDE